MHAYCYQVLFVCVCVCVCVCLCVCCDYPLRALSLCSLRLLAGMFADMAILEEFEIRMSREDCKGKESKDKAEKDWKSVPLRKRLFSIVNSQFARVTYTEAIEILKKVVLSGEVKFSDEDIHWGMDMASEHERYLCEKRFKRPTIVTNYPKEIKAFYSERKPAAT